MSDLRRRRKSHQSGDSDELSDSSIQYEELNVTKETQSSEQTEGHQESDCEEIYESDSEIESQDGGQRESGDGQEEEKPQKKLDDDEDRRNPQYIPKRGTFYEHDDRTADEVADAVTETPSEREIKEKKVWKDKVEDRWDHDRYNDEEQAPKSHEELIAVYGYDIRNEEGPPRARRRRRYGRGPNKYTRNWEDEDAYGKPSGNIQTGKNSNRKFNRGGEDFPALGSNKKNPAPVEEPVISSAWYSSKNKVQNKAQNFPPLQPHVENQKIKTSNVPNTHLNENKAPNEPSNSAWKKDIKHASHTQSTNGNNAPSGDAEKLINPKISPKDSNKRNIQESASLAASRTRGRGFKASANNNVISNRAFEVKGKGRGAGPILNENRRNNMSQQDIDHPNTRDTKHANSNDSTQYHQGGRHNKNLYTQSPIQQRSNTVPPRLQQQQQQTTPSHQQQQQSLQAQQHQSPQQPQQDVAANRPKRYSSLRQRPAIQETPNQQTYPPQHGQHGYFSPQAGNSRGVLDSQGFAPGHFEQSAPVATSAPAIGGQPVISLPPSGQPASYAPPPFLVPPPQFIPPQSAPPSIINYVPGPNGPAFPANFQGYQGYNSPVQPQGPPPQELFQPQGCTYYSPAQQQQQQQQSAPFRRPKAAIPILPPPDNQQHQSRGRGRSTQQSVQPSCVQQIEKDAKTEIVENNHKFISGQFDNVQSEEQNVEKRQRGEVIDALPNITKNEHTISANAIVDTVDITTNVTNTANMINASSVTTAEVCEGIRDVTLEEKTVEKINSPNSIIVENKTNVPERDIELAITKTETELNNSEIAVSDGSVVEEAAA
ncbi:protein CASC3-like [Prorops nasuta]|uniref:protein CASC3-like n=1 Tax=Prorops nasuta TaxID=863751 RepID=UPI0034CEC93C